MAEETESMTEGKTDRMIGTEIEIKLGSETGADIDDHMSDTTEERENPAGRPKRKKLLFRVGLMITGVFILLIMLLGFLLVHNSESAFFEGQREALKQGLKQVQAVTKADTCFDWYSEIWEKYPEELKNEFEPDAFTFALKYDRYLDLTLSEEDLENLRKEPVETQITIAKYRTQSLAGRIMTSVALSGDGVYLIDFRKERSGQVYLTFPYEDQPSEHMGEEFSELIVDEDLADQIRSTRVEEEDVYFISRQMADENYYIGYAPIYSHEEARFAVVMIHDWTEFHDDQVRNMLWMLASMVVVLGIGGALLLLFISTATVGPVKRLRYGVRRYTKDKDSGTLREDMAAVNRQDEFGELAGDITEMAEEIDRYMNENVRLAGEREAAAAELQIATRVQQEQLPSEYPESPYFTMQAFIRPAKEVGGDFYDFFMPDENHLVILVSDVSDKGMDAAFFMAISKAMIKASAMKSLDPVEIITEAEDMLRENNPTGMFVTTWIGVIDLPTGHVEACNAGHDYPAVRKKDRYVVEKTPHGPAVSFLPGVKHEGYGFDLEPGERIFLYTDGVVEALREEGERFGVSRLEETLNKAPADATDEELIRYTRDAVDAFAGESPQFDDMTMLSFSYRGGN